MFNFSKDRLSLANYACGVVLLVMLIMQFMPFWSFDYNHTYTVQNEVEVPVEPTAAPTEETAAESAVPAEGEEAEAASETPVETKKEIVEEEVTEVKKASLSIASYLWFTTSEPAAALIEQYIPATLGTPIPLTRAEELAYESEAEGTIVANDIVLQPVLQFVFALIVIGLCFVATKNICISILTLLSGALGIWAYLGNPVMQLGSAWQLHLAVSIIMIPVGLTAFIFAAKTLMEKRKARLEALKNKSLQA